MSRTWNDGAAPYLSAANLNGMETDITAALGVPDAALAARINDPASSARGALNATYAPITTKRATLTFGSANNLVGAATFDYCQRAMFMLPVGAKQYRFRVCNRNNNTAARAPLTTPITITGLAVGSPAYRSDGRWTAAFTAPPTTVVNTNQTVPVDGNDWISPWITAPTLAPHNPIMYSMGWTSTAVGTGLMTSITQGFAVSSAGSSGQYATTTPTGGTIGSGTLAHDVRIEYDFTARQTNLVGLFIGDSIIEGQGDGDQTASPQAGTLPHETWPGALGLRAGHAVINAGVAGSSAGGYWCANGRTPSALGRFDLSTTVPDYAVIGAGSNDANLSTALSTYQSNISTIITDLRSLGIQRIYVATVIPRNFAAGPEAVRVSYNNWLRDLPFGIDGCIDMDKALRNPAAQALCESDVISADNTHPLRSGYQRMAQAAAGIQ